MEEKPGAAARMKLGKQIELSARLQALAVAKY